MASNNNETVHISLGTTANYISSHLLNLQGLAATASSSSSSSEEDAAHQSLCDPSVTHDIASIDSDYYSTYGGSSSYASRYMYVPRALIVDGRDAFGTSWGGVSRNSNTNYNANQYHQPSPTSSSFSPNILSQNDPNDDLSSAAWSGAVSIVNTSDHDLLFGSQSGQHNDSSTNVQQAATHQSQHQQYLNERGEDPLYNFQNAASIMGLSPQHSRFNAAAPAMSYNIDRHVQWDDEEENEEEEDDYYYGYNNERRQEEKRRQLERMEYQNQEARKNWNMAMEDAWEEAFYNKTTTAGSGGNASTSLNANDQAGNTNVSSSWDLVFPFPLLGHALGPAYACKLKESPFLKPSSPICFSLDVNRKNCSPLTTMLGHFRTLGFILVFELLNRG